MFNYDMFQKEQFEKLMLMVKRKDERLDYIGAIRIGLISIDIVCHPELNNQIFLDFYVLDEDTGYGYTKNNRPYDYADGIVLDFSDNFTYESFKRLCEKKATEYINSSNNLSYSLLEKAKEPLVVEW